MSTYLKSYGKRLKRNHAFLMDLADELVTKGYKVKYIKYSPHVSGITVLDEKNKGVRLQFNEVPYRWSLEYNIKPSEKYGSGEVRETDFPLDNPVTADELVTYFRPMYVDVRFGRIYTIHQPQTDDKTT